MKNSPNFDILLEQGNQFLFKRSNSTSSKDHIEDYQKELKKNKYKKKFRNKIFICKACHYIPKIKFISETKVLKISCKCKKCYNIKSKDFIEEYGSKKRINKNIFCKEHKNEYFEYYCIDCKQNLCEKCAKKEIHYHHVKTFEHLSRVDDKIKEILLQIDDIRTKLQPGDIENRQILNIIEILVNNYNIFRCHNQYYNLREAEKFINSLKSEIPKIEKKEMIRINNIKDLERYNSQSDLFFSININQVNFNLSKLKYLPLNNLEHLKLTNTGLTNIDGILNKEFDKLKTLNLALNKLTYKNFEKFEPKKFKELETLNLFSNEIKSIKIFSKFADLKNLKELYIGGNIFDIEEIKKYNKKKIHFPSLKLLGITRCLSEDIIKFLSYLICEDLEVLYISKNNLGSLKYMKECKFKNLKKFWSVDNKLKGNIKDVLKYLPSKETLEIINLEENNINNLDGFEEIIYKFPKLKEINLKKNEIDLNKYGELIKNIKEKTKGRLVINI